jgi:rhamnulokinase
MLPAMSRHGYSTAHLAFDLGAESGRVMLGAWDGESQSLEEVFRFPNRPLRCPDGIQWDVDTVYGSIITGLQAGASAATTAISTIGLDTWGVDYAVLDDRQRLLGAPYHYRDARTEGTPSRVYQVIRES